MGSRNDEIERIQRIREQQIRARDPRATDRKRAQRIRTRRTHNKVTFGDAVRDIPGKWWGTILGGLIGLIAAMILGDMVKTSWVIYAEFIIVFAGAVIGRTLGMVMDWREEDHDKLVR